jgi:hypothetical protein
VLTMPKYPFLSDEWVEEARLIYGQARADGPLLPAEGVAPARVNLVVTEVPFSSSAVQAHLDTSSGELHIETGHLEHPDVTVSMAYATARSLFVAGDVQSVMAAFLGGRVRVDGDLSKLLDPRSGIWPGGAGASPFGPSTGAGAAPGGDGGPPGPGLGGTGPGARDVAAQLREITE